MRLAAEQAVTTIAAQKTINEAALNQLRKELDNIIEYQADRAPSWVSLEGAEYPEREGSLKDVLAARQMFAEAEMLEESEEDDDEGEDEVDETSDDKMVDAQTNVQLEMGDASAPLEETDMVEKSASEHGGERVITGKLQNLTLDQEIQEASPAKSKAKLDVKPEEVKSPKKLVASPAEKTQSKANLQPPSKAHWRPRE
jgi:hypothetical protein